MGDAIDKTIGDLCRSAVHCGDCFNSGLPIARARVDIAQPRCIGSRYWSSTPRVLVVLTNPGAGNARDGAADLVFRKLLIAYREGEANLQKIFEHQRADMDNWGDLIPFYIDGFGLDIDETAFINIAWCASVSKTHPPANAYPSKMLNHCFTKYTSQLIRRLNPELFILGGNKAQDFEARLRSILPASEVTRVLHYSHRPRDLHKRPRQIAHVRAVLARLRGQT